MGRTSHNPRYNVISMRISDDEQKLLQQITHTTHQSTSEIMREALLNLLEERTTARIGRKAA